MNFSKMFLPTAIFFFVLIGVAHAGCFVEDGTFYSTSKSDISRFAIAMDNGNKDLALEMVDQGRIGSCGESSCSIVDKDGALVKVKISGVGTVWIYYTFLHCN